MLYHNCGCTMFSRKVKKLKNSVQLELTKASLNLLKSLSNVGFVYSNINCRLKVHFSNSNESFFGSMNNLISKKKCFRYNNWLFISHSCLIFTCFWFKITSMLEASAKEDLKRRHSSRFDSLREKYFLGDYF